MAALAALIESDVMRARSPMTLSVIVMMRACVASHDERARARHTARLCSAKWLLRRSGQHANTPTPQHHNQRAAIRLLSPTTNRYYL